MEFIGVVVLPCAGWIGEEWGIPEDHGRSCTWVLDYQRSANGLERIVKAVGELLHTGHAEGLS